MKEFNELSKRHLRQDEKEDSRVALLCAVIVNSHRGKKGKKVKPQDFMPGKKKKKESWQEQLGEAKRITALFGGSIKGGDKS